MALPFTNSIRRQGPTTLILSDEEPCLLTTAPWITSFAVTQITNISCCEIPSSSFCDFWKSILPVLLHHLILLYYLCHEFSSIPVVLHIVAFLKRQPFQNLNCTMIYAYFKYVLNIARGPTDPGYWVRNMWISHSLQVGKSKQFFWGKLRKAGKVQKVCLG